MKTFSQLFCRIFLFGPFAFSLGVRAQEERPVPFAGYQDLAWGTSLEEVKARAPGVFDGKDSLHPESWNAGPVAAYTGFSMGPEAYRLRYHGHNGEATEYFVVQDRLCMVIRTPDFQEMFRPARLIRQVERVYDAPVWKSERTDLPLPPAWGKLSTDFEFLLTLQWENEDGRVRLAIKTWKPMDMRQAFRIVYMSRTLSDENPGRLATFRRQEAEEALRLRQEAEAARAAAEAPKP